MKGTELQLHLARKTGSRNFSGAIFWAYSGVFFNSHENTLECSADFTDQWLAAFESDSGAAGVQEFGLLSHILFVWMLSPH